MSREKFETWGMSDPDLSEMLESEVYASISWMAWQAASKASEQQLAAVVAENAGLKSGQLFFMRSDATGFEIHKTREAAIVSAEDMLSDCREEASSEGWSEETGTICWGIIMQKAFEGEFEKPSESNGFIGWSEYSLQPTIKTPATDAFLAEVRAQGVDALNIQFKKCSGMLYADSVIETAAEFAAQLRQGAAL